MLPFLVLTLIAVQFWQASKSISIGGRLHRRQGQGSQKKSRKERKDSIQLYTQQKHILRLHNQEFNMTKGGMVIQI